MNDRIQHGHDARVPTNFTGNTKVGPGASDPAVQLVKLAEQQVALMERITVALERIAVRS